MSSRATWGTHQSDEANRTRQCRTGGAEEYRRKPGQAADTSDVHTQSFGHLITQGQGVDPGRQAEGEYQSKSEKRQDRHHEVEPGARDSAHLSEVIRADDIDARQKDGGGKRPQYRTDHDTGQGQP